MEHGCQRLDQSPNMTLLSIGLVRIWLVIPSSSAVLNIRLPAYLPMRLRTRFLTTPKGKTPSDLSIQQEGHIFYCLTFPTANATWYSISSNSIGIRGPGWTSGNLNRWRPNCFAPFNNQLIVGDGETAIYTAWIWIIILIMAILLFAFVHSPPDPK